MSWWFGGSSSKKDDSKPLATKSELRAAIERLDLNDRLSLINFFDALNGEWQVQFTEYVRRGDVPVQFIETALEAAQRKAGL